MVKVLLHGCGGRMGKMITGLAKDDPEIKIVAGVDVLGGQCDEYPVYTALADVKEEADVVVDFAVAAAMDGLMDYCAEKNLPVVLCTTGLSEAQEAKVDELAKKVAVLKSANMSLGVNVILKLLADATKALADNGYDIEIVEKHHNQKVDAPSGTALAMADAINAAADGKYEYVYDRSERRAKRPENEIGISSLRGGNLAGIHEVYYIGTDEIVEIRHTANSRAIFGKGAISAAKFLAGKPAGRYSMADVIG